MVVIVVGTAVIPIVIIDVVCIVVHPIPTWRIAMRVVEHSEVF